MRITDWTRKIASNLGAKGAPQIRAKMAVSGKDRGQISARDGSSGDTRMEFSDGGADDELQFWKDVIKRYRSGELDWLNDKFSGAARPSDIILNNVKPSQGPIKILDVGCGPFGTLDPCEINGHPVVITGIDPLAADYRKLLDECGLVPKIEYLTSTAEDMDRILPAESFDFVNADNSLDHCYDPEASIRNMLKAVKPGGIVRIKVFVNEGEFTGYSGFHQWNFDCLKDRVIVWNRDKIFFVDDFLDGSPYEIVRDTEFTSTDNVLRDVLVLRIVKVDKRSHTFESTDETASVAFVHQVNALVVEKLKNFHDNANIFIHWHDKDPARNPPVNVSIAARGNGRRVVIRAPNDHLSHCVVGQFTAVREGVDLSFNNLWQQYVKIGDV
ncbi:class I SAM-dependent methyltransferase [Novosphingobium sp.]|uniref:class I SAM-dependent methyltransferase n=1 Tax=Novosphingobium sp. TaxID=1874826 RepID=UPI003B53051B